MEAEETSRKFWPPSHDTALCLIPPQDLWPVINALRCFNDKAYGKWPPHINLVYPFVQPAVLDQASDILTQIDFSSYNNLTVSISETGTFVHDKHNTIYVKPEGSQLSALANDLRKAMGWPAENLTPHLTVAQTEDAQSSSHKFMLEKARLITPLKWQASQLAIMVRDQDQDADGLRRMRIWKCIDLETKSLVDLQLPQDEVIPTDKGDSSRAYQRTSYQYSLASNSWSPLKEAEVQPEETPLDRLIVASYNVLAEFHWPPDTSRNPMLISNLLSTRAAADILVLQEVSDHFLPDLLSSVDICNRYPFSTHAPASSGAGPLASLLNVVVLSKFPVKWEYLPLQKRHKGATIATFPTITFNGQPLVVSGCHLTQGLVDGAITAKKIELLRLMRYLADKYSESARLMVGDFNLTTSSYTIDLAQRRQALSSNGKQTLDDVNEILTGSSMQDVWLVTRVESGESSTSAVAQDAIMNLYEGEQGATFDPLTNTTTANLVGSGLNNRPQRYDRILFNKNLPLHPTGFNMFGQDPMDADDKGVQYYASDHWGIRCLFTKTVQHDAAITAKTKPVELFEAPESLGGIEDLKKVLFAKGCLPAEADETSRALALKSLENALLRPANEQDNRSVGLVLVPVGSYGLGVWMSSSDVDCLCIGTISSRTFFTVALQRLRKATAQGITVLRRVKANSGTMLELDVQGIKFDLQYCPATNIVEGYPEILNYPSTHPAFSLPIQTLSKLKPARDMSYLRRSIPDLAKFRVAFLCIKAWAMSRGLYGAKFGFLGGIHIDVLLVPVCKALAKTTSAVSTTDIVTTFFHHYATFDWQTQMVFDPFFHKDIRYHRTSREPMCLLGWHAPALNTAMTASVPTVKTIAIEMTRADEILSKDGATWDALLDAKTSIQGSKDFLMAYKSYVKVDARFWGSSPTQGRRFLGWLESRCVAILVDIDRKAGAVLPRIWPARFTDKTHEEGAEYHGFYLIGLAFHDASLSKDDAKSAESSLQTVLRDFEARMRNDEKYYDSSTSWLSATVVKSSQLADAVLDPNAFAGDHGDSDEDLDSDDEEDIEDDNESLSDETNSRKKVTKLNAKLVPKPEGMGKFRSAADVMNRIRWDVGMDESDYIIGFEDRFTGAMEKPLSHWKTEQTDEEFIPQHRILYFKRKSDGEIMWERRTRIDKIFNSGIKSASH